MPAPVELLSHGAPHLGTLHVGNVSILHKGQERQDEEGERGRMKKGREEREEREGGVGRCIVLSAPHIWEIQKLQFKTWICNTNITQGAP